MIYQMESRKINEIVEPRVDLEKIPLISLSLKSRSKLSTLLNSEKVLVNEDGYFRDWRGLFMLTGLPQSDYSLISQSDDKFKILLDHWIRRINETNKSVSLSQLQQCFGIIDRYDISDDLMTFFVDDAVSYQKRESQHSQSVLQELPVEPENSNIITTIDKEHYEEGLSLPIYDALVIYSDKDADFTADLVKRMREKKYLLCLKDDLLPGLPFEFDSLLTILSKRCNRLIVIISKEFLESKMHIFFTNYAQTLGIEQGKRKIIPCVLEPCELPQMLRFCYRLDYYRNSKLFDFWDKLDKSLQLTVEGGKKSVKSIQPSAPPQQQEDIVYKFSETPTTPEKIKKSIEDEIDSEPKRQIMPPPRRLRQTSSMIGIDESCTNGSLNKSELSHSTLNISQQSVEGTSDGIKLKRKKWYSMFLPPHKEKVERESMSTEKKEKKKKWFKSRKKEKIAVEL